MQNNNFNQLKLNSYYNQHQPQSLVTDGELIESLLNHFNDDDNNNNNNNTRNNNNNNFTNNNNKVSVDQQQLDHLLLLSPSSTNSVSTASLSSPSNPTPILSHNNYASIQHLSSSQPQPIYHQFHHPIPSADLSIGFKPSIDRFSNSPHIISSSLPDQKTSYSTIDPQTLALTEKRRKRRESHNAVERRRRDNINDRISELASLLPNCVLDTVVTPTESGMLIVNEQSAPSIENMSSIPSKPNKGIILAKSVDYIKHLKELLDLQVQRNAELEAELNDLRTSMKREKRTELEEEEWIQRAQEVERERSMEAPKRYDKQEKETRNTVQKGIIKIKTEETDHREKETIDQVRKSSIQDEEMVLMMNEFCHSNHTFNHSSSNAHHDQHNNQSISNLIHNNNNTNLSFHLPYSFDHVDPNQHLDRLDHIYQYLK